MRTISKSAALAALLWTCLVAPTAHAVPGEEEFDPDPRVNEAMALLGDDSQRAHVVALFEEVLQDTPDQVPARLWLARVLSWDGRYDESLRHYEVLIEGGHHIAQMAIERADVLSWAGRYDEAEAAYHAIVAENRTHARALRGLAHVYDWSGRKQLASRFYERALEAEEHAETRAEYERLRGALGTLSDSGTGNTSDSDGFSMWDVSTEGAVDLGYVSRILYHAGYVNLEQSRAPGEPGASELDGFDVLAGYERDLGSRVTASAQAGYRRWNGAADRPLARGAIDYNPFHSTALGLDVEYGDFLSRSASLDAVEDDIAQVSVRASVWQGLTKKWSVFSQVESSFLSDGNDRIAVGASGAFVPWLEHDFQLGLGFSYLTYTERSDAYYDPVADLGVGVTAQGSWAFTEWFGVAASTRIGFGHSIEQGLDPSSGFVFEARAGPRFKYAGWWLNLEAARAQSVRENAYSTTAYRLGVGKRF